MNEPINKGNTKVIKARTISLYEDEGISHTIEIQSSRRINNNSSMASRTNSKKKKKRQFKEDEDSTFLNHHSSYHDDFESPNRSGSIHESIQRDSKESLSRYSQSKERSKKIEKPLTNSQINKLFVECNQSQKGNNSESFKTKVYIDSLLHNRNDIEYQQSSIEYENTSVSNQRVSENSKKQTINSQNTNLREKFPRQWVRQSQSPQGFSERSQKQVDENDFKFTIANVHKISAYEPRVYKQLLVPNQTNNQNGKKISTASTQQDQYHSERYPRDSEVSLSHNNDHLSPKNTYLSSSRQSPLGNRSPNYSIDEIINLGNNNNLLIRKKRKLKKKNQSIIQNEQTENTYEEESNQQNINQLSDDGSIRVQANKFLLSNRGSQMQQIATPSNLHKILNSTKQARKKSFVFHNSPRMIKNAYGVGPSEDQLKNLKDQFKEKVKEIQEFNKNHTNTNFFKRNRTKSIGRVLSPNSLNQTHNGFSYTPKQADKQNKQPNAQVLDKQNNTTSNASSAQDNKINQISHTVQMQQPSSSHSRQRRKSYQNPHKTEQLQLPLVQQSGMVGYNNPKPSVEEKPQYQESLFNYINSSIPKSTTNGQTKDLSQNQQIIPTKMLNPIRSKTPNIKSTKSRNNSKNNNSPRRQGVNSKQQNVNNITQLYQNSPRNKQI